jgi:hypothetical protein
MFEFEGKKLSIMLYLNDKLTTQERTANDTINRAKFLQTTQLHCLVE